MIKNVVAFGLICLLTASCSQEKSDESVPAERVSVSSGIEDGCIALIVSDQMPEGLAKEICNDIREELFADVRMYEGLSEIDRDRADALVVVLKSEPVVIMDKTLSVQTNQNLCIVNVSPLLESKEGDGVEEIIRQRVGKEVFRALGRMVGLSPCLNPWCVM